MDKAEKFFLNDPNVMDCVLNAALAGGLIEAMCLGARTGAMVAAIVIDGGICLKSRALEGGVEDAYDSVKKWDDDPAIGVNYVGYAIGKVMQSMRTRMPSKAEESLGYGESDDAGSGCVYCNYVDVDGKKVDFLLLTAYSGMDSENDCQIARAAIDKAWLEMLDEQGGLEAHLFRLSQAKYL